MRWQLNGSRGTLIAEKAGDHRAVFLFAGACTVAALLRERETGPHETEKVANARSCPKGAHNIHVRSYTDHLITQILLLAMLLS